MHDESEVEGEMMKSFEEDEEVGSTDKIEILPKDFSAEFA